MGVLEMKNSLRERFKSEGLSPDQIEARLTAIDVDFLLRCFMNEMESLPPDKRMQLYVDILQRELDM